MNLENLPNTKVFYVHEECLRNLVRARKSQKSIFGASDLWPPPPSPLMYHHMSLLCENKYVDVFWSVLNYCQSFLLYQKKYAQTKQEQDEKYFRDPSQKWYMDDVKLFENKNKCSLETAKYSVCRKNTMAPGVQGRGRAGS